MAVHTPVISNSTQWAPPSGQHKEALIGLDVQAQICDPKNEGKLGT